MNRETEALEQWGAEMISLGHELECMKFPTGTEEYKFQQSMLKLLKNFEKTFYT
jgi:hypothetical protein